MEPEKTERLIAAVYDAAVDNDVWNQALVMLAELTQCALVSLEIHNRDADTAGASLPSRLRAFAPLCSPEASESYIAYWHTHFSWRGRIDHFPVGRVFASKDVMDIQAILRSAFYHEWVVPHGGGGDARCANLLVDSRATVMLGVFRSKQRMFFEEKDHRVFEAMVPHFVRAVSIQRRLRLAEAQRTAMAVGSAPDGFLIVDRHGRVLAAHEPTHLRLRSAGLLASAGDAGRIDRSNPAIEKLVRAAVVDGAALGAGQVEHRGLDGVLLHIAVIPLSQSDRAAPDDRWLAVDRPAALLHVTAPEEKMRACACRLADDYGLTPAEAAVAVEIAKGDGRAAVAARLGIRDTTVRSHLSAIFDKLGIHRQAELTRIVAAGSC